MTPRRSPAPCTTPGCPELVAGGGRCPDCARKADLARGSSTERGYGSRWRRRRERFLRAHPTCERDGCWGPSTDAHHTIPRRVLVAQGVADPDDDRYLQALCHPHHSSVTAREDVASERRFGR